jgi:hypothetical protein
VKGWEEEEGMKTTLTKNKLIQYNIQWEVKKMDTQFPTPIKQ